MEFLRHIGRWPYALAWVFVLAAAILLPGLDASGLWEPQERSLADRVAPRPELAKKQQAVPQMEPAPPKDGCYRIPPKDALARSLTNRAMTWGRDHVADSDAGRRLPLALLGLLTVLASAGIAMRLGGARAGVVTTLVLLSMPLLVFQSRMLTSEIGTAAGGALILYGFVALGERRGVLGVVESLVALASLAAGVVLAFLSGGALLGLLVPIGAYAIAHGLGFSLVRTVGRDLYLAGLGLGRVMRMRWALARQPQAPGEVRPVAEQLKSALATLAVIGIAAILVYQIYSLSLPQPGLQPPQRALLGKAIVPDGCWSSALGALWRPEDDLRYTFDSTFEQIAYGTFPWGILGPIAMFALMSSADRRRRLLGSMCLVWTAGAWIACEAFQRKVGFTIWSGFPALAIAIGTWLDDVLGGRAKTPRVMPAGAVLLGFFVAVAMFDLGKDLQSFTEKLTSLLIGGDQIAYPKMSRLGMIPTRAWLMVLAILVGAGFAVTMATWREDVKRVNMRLAALVGTIVALACTAVFGAFWAFGWEPALARHLSSKAMFDTYTELKKPGDQLVIMGDMGDAPYDYAPDAKPEIVSSRDKVVEAIARPSRVFAIAPQTELCQLHREIGGKPYFVLDDQNVRSLLLSNRVDGTTDKNPLRTTILHAEPRNIQSRPMNAAGKPVRVVFDGKIELLGWSMPKHVPRGDKFEVKMFYKILQPVGANWKVLFHFDGPLRFNGDHDPIDGRCQTSTWQPGDFIVDTHTVTAGGSAFAPGPYEVWTGFFTGTNPNWKNMTISEAAPEMRDTADRVKITTITLD